METAFWDLAAKRQGVPLHVLLTEKLGRTPLREAPSAVEVYASFWEHRAPAVRVEAMERARPVIASAVGGLPEIVADGETGLVVPSGDSEALAEAIVALAGDLDRARAMGLAGRERALAEFTPERSARRIEELYAGALGSGAGE